VTCSAIKPLIKLIGDKYVSPQESDAELTKEIKVRIKDDIENCYSSSEIILLRTGVCDVCSFLDPRFKDGFDLQHIAKCTLLEEITSNELDIVQPAESENGPKPARKKWKFSKVFGVRSTVSTTTMSVPERLKREVL